MSITQRERQGGGETERATEREREGGGQTDRNGLGGGGDEREEDIVLKGKT